MYREKCLEFYLRRVSRLFPCAIQLSQKKGALSYIAKENAGTEAIVESKNAITIDCEKYFFLAFISSPLASE